MMGSAMPPITIVMPVLDEERHVGQALTSLLEQLDGLQAEILVMDGGSRDATVAIVSRLAADHPVIRLIHNPARLQSAACNLAAGMASTASRVLLRTDAHAGYPPGFVRTCVMALFETDATSVVVPMRTVGTGTTQRAIAAAQNSRLGNGGSAHRTGAGSGFVDHGHHAAFDLDFFRALDGYDPSFTHNEDAELDVRVLQAGGRIWLCRDAMIDYYPRASLGRLASQYFRHGRGRARTVAKHGLRLRQRQQLPLVILLSLCCALFAPFAWPLALPAAAYLIACMAWGVAASVALRDPALLLMGPAAVVMHASWAVGFLEGRVLRRRLQAIARQPVLAGL